MCVGVLKVAGIAAGCIVGGFFVLVAIGLAVSIANDQSAAQLASPPAERVPEPPPAERVPEPITPEVVKAYEAADAARSAANEADRKYERLVSASSTLATKTANTMSGINSADNAEAARRMIVLATDVLAEMYEIQLEAGNLGREYAEVADLYDHAAGLHDHAAGLHVGPEETWLRTEATWLRDDAESLRALGLQSSNAAYEIGVLMYNLDRGVKLLKAELSSP